MERNDLNFFEMQQDLKPERFMRHYSTTMKIQERFHETTQY